MPMEWEVLCPFYTLPINAIRMTWMALHFDENFTKVFIVVQINSDSIQNAYIHHFVTSKTGMYMRTFTIHHSNVVMRKCNGFDPLWHRDAIWLQRYGLTFSQVMTGTNPFSESMLIHRWGSMIFTWKGFHSKCTSHNCVWWVWNYTYYTKFLIPLPGPCSWYVTYVWDSVSILNHLPSMFCPRLCFSNNGLNQVPWTSYLHAILRIISRGVSGLATDSLW